MYNDDASSAFTELKDTLLARNGANCAGAIVSDGSNLDTAATCAFGFAADQSNVGDATVGLATLASNGGPTQGSTELSVPMMTQALAKTSPAVDAVAGTCPPPATDERGVLRGIAACDIGAFELTQPPTVTFVQSVNPSGNNVPSAGNNSRSGQNPDGFPAGCRAPRGSRCRPPGPAGAVLPNVARDHEKGRTRGRSTGILAARGTGETAFPRDDDWGAKQGGGLPTSPASL